MEIILLQHSLWSEISVFTSKALTHHQQLAVDAVQLCRILGAECEVLVDLLHLPGSRGEVSQRSTRRDTADDPQRMLHRSHHWSHHRYLLYTHP
jgi:hypothetical protein